MPQVDGSRWRDRRAELDLAPATAADALGIPKGTLRNIETVQSRPVSLRVIHRASRLYGRSVEWLQGKDDEETPPAKPEPAPEQPRRDPPGDPRGPARRDDRTGPPRTDSLKAAS